MRKEVRFLTEKKESKRSKETKDNMKKSMDERIEKQRENQKALRKLETEMIEKKYKEGLKDHLEQRLYDLKYAIKHFDSSKTHLTIVEIDKIIRGKTLIGTNLYSAEELAIVFDYYRDFISEINTTIKYIPSKKNFCAFAKMSSTTYDSYLINGDAQRIEVMRMIDDYITDISLTLAQNREIDNVTTIYRSKAEHGMVEATAPIIIKHEETPNLAAIKEQLEALKAGKSLKNIELSQDDYKIEN